jgi:hypothetical protein
MADLKVADYGYVEAFLNAYPEIRDAINAAIAAGETGERFQMRLRETNWYKWRTEAQRKYDTMLTSDKATLDKQVADKQAAIKQLLVQLGVNIPSDATLNEMAQNAVRNDLDDAAIRAWAVAQGFAHGAQGEAQGVTATSVDELRSIASQYGVPVSDATLSEQLQQILRGERTPEQFTDYYREMAKRQYGSISAQLDQGYTVKQILDPYLDIATRELGVSKDSMLLTDPKWTKMLQQNGGQSMLTYDEWRKALRTDKDYGWDKSAVARQEAVNLAGNFAKAFGGM